MLLEALIAMIIFVIGILGLIGIQAAMVRNTADAQFRSTATYLAQQAIGMFWADPKQSQRDIVIERIAALDGEVANLLPNGEREVFALVDGSHTVRVVVKWAGPDGIEHNVTLRARVAENDDID
ncbi:type IV pilus modification PilV family protein [Thauera butanivorans]|uniref:type IV pilus modification PilV family protein n=1 Tax=Thauera butanivorans TaxID=86174 RepID=UPI000B1FEE4E|nr:type IV pilus modification protein PilV [Thauera butanivorans]